jgi:hypothetical protein
MMKDEDLKLIDSRLVEETSLHLPRQSEGDCMYQLVSTGRIFVKILGTFVKICRENPNVVEVGPNYANLIHYLKK